MNPAKFTVIILTYNSESSLAQVVASCKGVAPRILVVDSVSADNTMALPLSAQVGMDLGIACDLRERTVALDDFERQLGFELGRIGRACLHGCLLVSWILTQTTTLNHCPNSWGHYTIRPSHTFEASACCSF